MSSVTRRLREEWTADLPLGPGLRTLRVCLVTGEAGTTGATLELSVGYGGGDSGDPFTRPGWADRPLSVPSEIIPELRRTLGAMEEASREEGASQ